MLWYGVVWYGVVWRGCRCFPVQNALRWGRSPAVQKKGLPGVRCALLALVWSDPVSPWSTCPFRQRIVQFFEQNAFHLFFTAVLPVYTLPLSFRWKYSEQRTLLLIAALFVRVRCSFCVSVQVSRLFSVSGLLSWCCLCSVCVRS